MQIRTKILLCCCAFMLVACGGAAIDSRTDPNQGFAEVNAQRGNLFSQINGQETPLVLGQPTQLRVGDSLRVDEGGSATLRFSDLVSVEILGQGNLQIQEISLDEESPLVAFAQRAGVFVNELKPAPDGPTRRLEIQSDFATITATGTRFLLVRERNTPLEWLWALDAPDGHLTLAADGITRVAPTGTAYWIAPDGPPSQAIEFDPDQVTAWINALRRDTRQGEVGDALWVAADLLLPAGELVGEVAPGAVLALGEIGVTLAAEGLNGPAVYAQTDCNQDGILDIAATDGKLLFDLRAVAGRVRAVDLTVAGEVEADSLALFNPAHATLDLSPALVQRHNDSILSMRSLAERGQEPFHYAELYLADGCFLGISLTPPTVEGTPGAPRPAIPEALCTVSAAGLNLRRGPDVSFAPPIRLLRQGDELIPLGRTDSSGWIRVQTRDDGSEGWVSANSQFVTCAMPLGNLSTLSAPPTPVSQVVPTPTPTPANRTAPRRIWQKPVLLSPADGASFDANAVIELNWSGQLLLSGGRGPGVARRLPDVAVVDGNLRDDEYYQVTIHFSPAVDAIWSDVHLVKESRFVVPVYLNSREMSWDQRYVWSVAVVQRPPVGEVQILSQESESRFFYWNLPPASIPTPVPPTTPRPTSTPAATPTATSPATPTATPTSDTTATATSTPAPTSDTTATATSTPAPTGDTTATATSTPAPTSDTTATATSTPAPTSDTTATATNTPAPTGNPTATATNTPVPASTATPTAIPTNSATPTPRPTDTPVPTATPTGITPPSPTSTSTVLPPP